MTRETLLPAEQVNAIGAKFGGKLVRVANAFYSSAWGDCQVNTIEGANESDAERVYSGLLKWKGDPRTLRREGKRVFELYCRDAKVVRPAKYAFGFQPERVEYRVGFKAAPLASCDSMAWNRLFNAFLEYDAAIEAERPGIEQRIGELRGRFEFSKTLVLREFGLGSDPIRYSFKPKPSSSRLSRDGTLRIVTFDKLPTKAGIPCVDIEATIPCRSFAATQSAEKPADKLKRATPHWPSDDKAVISQGPAKLAKEPQEKLAALLKWIRDPENFRYGGEVVGSRYGVRKVLEQGYGHCWDASDLLITLVRAEKLPARQVAGWLHGVSGHVWVEVWIDGEWKQIDPTTGMGCGSDYIPYLTSAEGEIALAYLSPVTIEIVNEK